MVNNYNKYAKERHKSIIEGKMPSHRFVEKPMMKSMIPDLTSKKILMLGCGTAEEVELLKEFGAVDQNLIGIDISEKEIELAKEFYPNVEFIVGDMHNLPFKGETFDFIYSSLAVHYSAEPLKVYNEVHRVLKPGGLFLFSVGHPLRWASEKKRNRRRTS